MTTAQTAAQPSFKFGRIGRNHTAYLLAVVLLVAAVAPLVLAGGYGLTDAVFRFTASRTAYLASRVRVEERYLTRLKDLSSEDESGGLDPDYARERAAWLQQLVARESAQLAGHRAELQESLAADRTFFLRLMPAMMGGLAAILGLLYWGTCSSPAMRLLAHVGALPAGAGEAGATRLLEDLCVKVNLPPPKMYIIQSSVPYTIAAAADSHHAMLGVTRGALDLLDQRELEAILAHEISHIGNRDIRLNSLLASVTLFIRLPLSALRRKWTAPAGTVSPGGASILEMVIWRWGFRRLLFMGVMGLLLLPLLIYVFFVAPIVGHLIRAFVSHDREFMADFDAAWLTGNPEGLASALAKIGGATTGLCDSNPAFQHSCVAGAGATGG